MKQSKRPTRTLKAVNPKFRWELLKKTVKEAFIKFSRQQSSDEKVAISQLCEIVTDYENRMVELTDHEISLLQTSKEELDDLMRYTGKICDFPVQGEMGYGGRKTYEIFSELGKESLSS